MRRLLLATAMSVLLLVTGCTAATEGTTTSDAAQPLLARYGLDGKDTAEVIDHLDRLGGPDRPADLTASVRPDELVVAGGDQEFALEIPRDRFYLSVAPYVDQTHECFYHSLTTCQGELAATEVRVEVVDETNDTVLVDGTRTTFDNGFVGFWLPRNIDGTLRISYDGRSGETPISTDDDAPTCLTTLQLT